MTTLIIGGSSGLGLAIARQEVAKGNSVYITGRRDPEVEGCNFIRFDIGADEAYMEGISAMLEACGRIDTLIYAAGFFQDGRITDLTDEQVKVMMNVGIMAAVFITKRVLETQDELSEFVAITSTSQWTPRLYEPVYTAAKAGLAAYANSLSLDERVKKVLVAGPAGMATNFWHDTDAAEHDTSKMLTPEWVADQVEELRQKQYSYRFAKILREPARVEIVDER